jgi:hypothetical protein
MQHKMWSIQLDEKLHLAPIATNPQNVLDIATGTGIWAIDFGTSPIFSPFHLPSSISAPTTLYNTTLHLLHLRRRQAKQLPSGRIPLG